MIKIDFFLAAALYLFCVVVLVIGHWIFYNYFRGEEEDLFNRVEFLQQCPYCIYLFFNYDRDHFTICPRCRSYIGFEESKTRKDRKNDLSEA